MQKFKLLVNHTFTSTTVSTTSAFTSVNNYVVNNINSLGGGIVNFSNVRTFLNDKNNSIIINDFFSYLTGNTNAIQFSEIFHSDEKLAITFNEYYDSTIISNQAPGSYVINNSLTGTSATTIYDSSTMMYSDLAPLKGLKNIPLSINSSVRQNNVYNTLSDYTLDESYYIPVYITKNHSQLDRETYTFFKKDSTNTGSTQGTISHTILQGFVDINMETNENVNTTINLSASTVASVSV